VRKSAGRERNRPGGEKPAGATEAKEIRKTDVKERAVRRLRQTLLTGCALAVAALGVSAGPGQDDTGWGRNAAKATTGITTAGAGTANAVTGDDTGWG
jgi:hypothetical protein